MNENEKGFLDEVKEMVPEVRTWMDVDIDEQEYLERLSNFGEGYFDFSTFDDAFGQSGEIH